jgi:hypothetical protein
MENVLLPIFFIYFIWRFLKPEKNILRTPLFGHSLDYYIIKECKPDENFRMVNYER